MLASVLKADQQIRSGSHTAIAFQIQQGPIASGDQFVSSSTEVKALREAFAKSLCVAMECAALAHVCYDYNIPFVAVRTVSDRADDTAHLDFASFIHDVAGPYAVGLVSAWLRAQ